MLHPSPNDDLHAPSSYTTAVFTIKSRSPVYHQRYGSTIPMQDPNSDYKIDKRIPRMHELLHIYQINRKELAKIATSMGT